MSRTGARPARPGRTTRPGPILQGACDLLAALMVLPLLYAGWYATRAAWLVYHPRPRRGRASPESFGLAGERVWFPSADGLRLAAWWIPAAGSPAPAVVLGHGMGSESGKLLPLAVTLHEAGYHVLAYDLRNHGQSGRDRRLRGMSAKYGDDFHAAVRYVRDRPECRPGEVGCVGISMSAWTALEAARGQPALVRAVVCDSGPQLDIGAALRRSYQAGRARLPWPLAGPLMFRCGRLVFAWASRFFLTPEPWPRELGDHSIRLLFITGEADPVCRPVDLRAQVEWYPVASTWIVPRAGHTQASVVAADEYASKLLATMAAGFSQSGGTAASQRADAGGS